MNRFPNYHTYPDNTLQGPGYPMPPGGNVPDLNLAGTDGWNVASGSSIQPPTPTPEKVIPAIPELSGSPAMGGIDPGNTIPDLNLAGVDGVPTPDVVARPNTAAVGIAPDFHVPDFHVPGLAQGDLTGPGIEKRDEYAPDPSLPDLRAFSHPHSLDIHTGPNVLMVDPSVNDLLHYDQPNGLSVNRDPLMPDPMVPDLQHPDLTQQVHMLNRPGDLDPSALAVMDGSKTAQLIAGKDYPEVQMDQRGYNNTRARHMSLLMDGLRDEEK